MKARCMRCRTDREIKNMKEIIMKGKGGTTRRAATGVCPKCDTKVFRFLKSKKKAA